MITAILVEDEAHSRKTLSNFLAKYCKQVRLLHSAVNVADAVQSISEHKPDLVFMDIDLPDGTGFEVLDQIPKPWPKIIFVTAYNQYAVKAFQISAIDYLLKPVDPELLIKAVEKAFVSDTTFDQQDKKVEAFIENRKTGRLSKMALPTQHGVQLVRINEIVRFEADGNYTKIYLKDKSKHMVSRKIKEFEFMLAELPFFRVHQSHIVNLEMIDRYIKGEGGTVILDDGSQIEVARRRKEEFLKRIIG
jgi:two-component system, LytTR family, response regulator